MHPYKTYLIWFGGDILLLLLLLLQERNGKPIVEEGGCGRSVGKRCPNAVLFFPWLRSQSSPIHPD